ncbi:MAG: hypothetical protein RJQ00_00885 [Vicingaceae bacterium]
MKPKTKLRFAVLLDSKWLKKWQADAIEDLIKSELAECVQLIQNKNETSYTTIKLSLGYKIIDRITRNSGPLEVVNIEDLLTSIPLVKVKPIQKGNANYFADEDLDSIKQLNLDFLLRFGFGILKGEILSIPTFGVWSFHHGDPTQFRGGPAGFWEIYNKSHTTAAILQRINHQLDQGEVLRRGDFQTINHSYKANLHHVLEEAKYWPTLVAKQICFNDYETFKKESKTKGKLYKIPSTLQTIYFAKKLISNKIKFHWNALFKAEKWNIGIVDQPIDSLVTQELAKVKWIKEAPKNRYYADPFPLSDKVILAECYNYRSQKGEIIQLDNEGYQQGTFLSKKTHLSYPYTIKTDSAKYLLPENYKNKSLCLYKIEGNKIVKEIHLLKGGWIDPSITFFENRWWLFCTSKKSPNEALYLFYAEHIEGPYHPHLLNPVLEDIKSARPAGTMFYKDNKLYRFGQNCSETYGGSIQMKKIIKLSPHDYQEEFVKKFTAKEFRTYDKGVHTLSAFGDKILVDAKRFHFNYQNFKAQLLNKLRTIKK